MNNNSKDTFIVNLYEKIFYILEKISIFYWLRRIIKNISYFFVDAWVLGNLFLSFLAVILTYYIIFGLNFYFG